jgi:NAD(P)-dependent dehydrogenase (short-subunit alcohol dehydrogenase family)
VKTLMRGGSMVNNAGIAPEVNDIAAQPGGLRVHETLTETFDRTMNINVRGVFLGCKYAIVQFLAQEPLAVNSRGDATRGWIVNVASLAGLVALGGAPCYTASKHAVVGLTKQIGLDYAKDRIHCNSLCPSCKFL